MIVLYALAVVFGMLGIACLVAAIRVPPPPGGSLGREAEDYLYRQARRDAELRRLRD